jgi:hypothetical protein
LKHEIRLRGSLHGRDSSSSHRHCCVAISRVGISCILEISIGSHHKITELLVDPLPILFYLRWDWRFSKYN